MDEDSASSSASGRSEHEREERRRKRMEERRRKRREERRGERRRKESREPEGRETERRRKEDGERTGSEARKRREMEGDERARDGDEGRGRRREEWTGGERRREGYGPLPDLRQQEYPFAAGYPPAPPPPGMPGTAYGPELTVGQTFSQALGIYRKHFGSFVAFYMLPIIIVIFLGVSQSLMMAGDLEELDGLMDEFFLREEEDAEGGDDGSGGADGGDGSGSGDGGEYSELSDEELMNRMVSSIVFLILIALMTFIFMAATLFLFGGGIMAMTQEGAETGKTSVASGFRGMGAKTAGVVALGVTIPIAVILGMCLCFVPGFFFCYWWLFAMPALLIEGLRAGDAVSFSKGFAKSRKTGGFMAAIFFLVLAIFAVASAITYVAAFALQGSLEGLAMSVATQTVSGVVMLLLMPLVFVLIATHFLRGTGRMDAPVWTP